MRQRQMLFSGPMIWALLAGRKTQTRRLSFDGQAGDLIWVKERWAVSKLHDQLKPSELPVRGMTVIYNAGGSAANMPLDDGGTIWRADDWPRYSDKPAWRGKTRASMYLPKWASRLTLRVLAVRREHLASISDADCMAEGVSLDDASAEAGDIYYLSGSHFIAGVNASPPTKERIGQYHEPRPVYRDLINLLHPAKKLEDGTVEPSLWDQNPVVSVIEFEPMRCNILDYVGGRP